MAHSARKNKKRREYPKIGKKTVRSDFEYNTYIEMKAHLPRGATLEYEAELLEYYLKQNYKPDLILEFKDGRKIYVECKGYFPYKDRTKMLAVREANPDLDIRLIFQRNSPSCLGRGSKSRPSDWATENNFTFSIAEIPKDWLE